MLYKTLFNINLYHAYFLDEGDRKFHDLQGTGKVLSEKDKKRIIAEYDSNDFLDIIPTDFTAKKIIDYRLILKKHTKGIRVFTEVLRVTAYENGNTTERYNPVIEFPESLTLSFYIKYKDRYFDNYSKTIDRNKPQSYFLSNKTSSATNIFNANNQIRLFNEFLASERDTRKAVYDLERENQTTNTNFSIATIDEAIISAIETKIVENKDLNETEKEVLNRLNAQVKSVRNDRVLGILQLEITGLNSNTLVETVKTRNLDTYEYEDKQCLLKEEFTTFNIAIENRSTFWRYNEPSKNNIMTTLEQKPLTQNGSIIIKKQDVSPQPNGNYFFPNPTPNSIRKENENYYSEIFI